MDSREARIARAPVLTQQRRLGVHSVSAIALGGARLSLADVGRDRAISTIRAAAEAGVTLFDTALAYAPNVDAAGHSERLFHEALLPMRPRNKFVIATKGGHYRGIDGFPIDGRPEALRAHCEQSLRNLRVERLDLYFLHWPDPEVPLVESVGALEQLRTAGKIEAIGLSNIAPSQLEVALTVAPITAVQNPFSVNRRDVSMLRLTQRLGIAYMAYSPLAEAEGDTAVVEIAKKHRASPQRVVLAWLLSLAPNLIPIIGATRPETARDGVSAAGLVLSPDEVAEISSR